MSIVRNQMSPGILTWKVAFCGLAPILALLHCDKLVAGTSVGTGNPTEIAISFKNDSGSVPVTGSLSVYASTQIPLPGLRTEPLLTVAVSGGTHATLNAESFHGLADSLWPKTSIRDGAYLFNLVISDAKAGAILRGFSYRKSRNDFVPREEDSLASGSIRMGVTGTLTPLVPVTCTVDDRMLNGLKDHFVFLYGTGYIAQSDSGKFTFPALPKGMHHAYLLSITREDTGGVLAPSKVRIYGLNLDLDSDSSTALTRTQVLDSFPAPKTLLPK
jgi:hypothetical protein